MESVRERWEEDRNDGSREEFYLLGMGCVVRSRERERGGGEREKTDDQIIILPG